MIDNITVESFGKLLDQSDYAEALRVIFSKVNELADAVNDSSREDYD